MLPKAINDLSRGTAPLAADLMAAAARVLDSGWFVMGREVAAFEAEFAAYCGSPECVSMGNGTDALEIAMRAVGVGATSIVATVANAGMYSSCAILALGARPLYVDVEPDTLLMDPAALRAQQLSRCSAIIVTHLYGRLARVEEIVEIAAAAGVPVIEDCAQAHGARRGGRRAGSFGAAGCFSFYPTKNLGALGDGGAVVTGDPGLAATLRKLRQYGWGAKYRAELPGGRNSRLDELQAAFLRAKLPLLDRWNERRRGVARRYAERISHAAVALPGGADESDVAHLYVLRSRGRDALAAHLKSRGVPTDVHYPLPDYRQPALAPAVPQTPLAHTEAACASVLTLPCFPEMSDAEVDAIALAVNEWRA